jgi:membrane protein DedA with SNARE-associated domain
MSTPAMHDFVLGLIQRMGHWAYLLLFLSTALETSAFLGLAVPGETIAVLGGFMVQRGFLDLGDTFAVIIAGAIVGDNVGYLLGRRLGRPWLHRFVGRFGLDPVRTEHVEELFRRRAGVAVVVGRLTAVMRAFIPFIAGSSGMRFRSFLPYNVVGGVVWGVAVVMVGYLFGASWTVVERWLGRVSTAVGAIVVVTLVLIVLWKRRPRRSSTGDLGGHHGE